MAELTQMAEVELASKCLRGDAAALAELETRYLSPAAARLGRRGFSSALIAEAVQVARLRLLMPSEQGAPPALLGYAGRGPLGRFVGVVVAHAAAGLTRRPDGTVHTDDEDALPARLGLGTVEAMLTRAHERLVVRAAVQRALASLTPRERAILRFHLMDGRTQEQIAGVYGVTRLTAGRWLNQTMDKLRDRARIAVAEALGQEGVAELVIDQIDLSLSRLLGGE